MRHAPRWSWSLWERHSCRIRARSGLWAMAPGCCHGVFTGVFTSEADRPMSCPYSLRGKGVGRRLRSGEFPQGGARCSRIAVAEAHGSQQSEGAVVGFLLSRLRVAVPE